MIKRSIGELAIYSTQDEMDYIFINQLQELYLNKTSEIVYITNKGKLYGIVCIGEALTANKHKGRVCINKVYTFLRECNVVKAHEVFQIKSKIHKIPIVNEKGELIGDYSRWDDLLYIKQNFFLFQKRELLKKILERYSAVYVIEPVAKTESVYLCMLNYLDCAEIEYEVIDKKLLCEKLTEKAVCIFLNEDERRGMQCLYGLNPSSQQGFRENVFRFDTLADSYYKVRFATLRTLINQLMQEEQLESLKIKNQDLLLGRQVDDKATIFLTELKQMGVQCFCLYEYENKPTEYGKKVISEIQKRLSETPLNKEDRMWVENNRKKEFYGQLYEIQEYEKGIVHKELNAAGRIFECKKEVTGRYFNAKDGRRITCYQPKDYIGTIYLLGPCAILGILTEDQYTIESFLQKKLLEEGYFYKVENYGSMSRPDACIDSRLEEIGEYSKNDIVIFLSRIGEAVGIQGISVESIFEKYEISSQWITDAYIHCNDKVNKLVADSVFNLIKPIIKNDVFRTDCKTVTFDFKNVMTEYIRHKYLELYFSNFNGESYESVGSIVMNCNPFSSGHRYLIEQAMQQVDFLIIFVVEEDKSLFPFVERFELVQKGIEDIENIMVVPSGEFILSENNFFEYFSKQEDATVNMNAEYDIGVFADYIAKPLHITHRFAGEETNDRVTYIYNKAMNRILPQKGITFVEIPRLEVEGEIVSASRVRQYLRAGMVDKAFVLLPKSTRKYLEMQL